MTHDDSTTRSGGERSTNIPLGSGPTPRKRYTQFQQGILAAAYILHQEGADMQAKEVLQLGCLTLDDLRKEYDDAR